MTANGPGRAHREELFYRAENPEWEEECDRTHRTDGTDRRSRGGRKSRQLRVVGAKPKSDEIGQPGMVTLP
jgi:hypothetical protein